MWISILTIGILAIMAFEDFKYRGITWFTFPILIILGMLHVIRSPFINFQSVLVNGLFVASQLLFLVLFFRIKHKKWRLFQEAFGVGDALMLVSLALFFDSVEFLVFIILSYMLILSLTVVALIRKNSHNTIPLAGWLATFAGLLLAMDSLAGFYVIPKLIAIMYG